jgi:hypothetical protein
VRWHQVRLSSWQSENSKSKFVCFGPKRSCLPLHMPSHSSCSRLSFGCSKCTTVRLCFGHVKSATRTTQLIVHFPYPFLLFPGNTKTRTKLHIKRLFAQKKTTTNNITSHRNTSLAMSTTLPSKKYATKALRTISCFKTPRFAALSQGIKLTTFKSGQQQILLLSNIYNIHSSLMS